MRYLRPVVNYIDSLESGDTFRKHFSFGLKFSGVLTLTVSILIGIVTFYLVGREAPALTPGAILISVIIVHYGIAVAMLCWNRAAKIAELGEESHLTFAPIIGVTGRLTGEISCLFFITFGVSGLVCSIFMPVLLESFLRGAVPGGFAFFISILIGLFLFFLCLLIAIFLLVFFYIIAEYTGLIGDIATNIKRIETLLSTAETSSALHEEITEEEDDKITS